MVMNLFGAKCPYCGKPVERGASFCGSCGKTLAGGSVQCGVCGADNPGDAAFCIKCGRALSQSSAPEIRGHHWARKPGDFAVRIEAEDLPGLLRHGITVEAGTNALLIERGVNRGCVPAGVYKLESAGQNVWNWISSGVPEQATILLVDVTPAEMEFNLDGRFTSDPLPVGISVRMQVDVGEPGKFLVNMLKGHEHLTLEDLRDYLYPQVIAVTDRRLRSQSLQDLAENPRQRDELELALEQELKQTFAQSGLRFLQVRAVELNLEPYDKIKGIRGKFALWEMEARTTLEGERAWDITEAERRAFELQKQTQREQDELAAKKRYALLVKEYDLLDLADETRKVENEEKRADLYARMRRAASSNKMDEVRSEADFARFLDEMDHEKLLKDRERAELQRVWGEADQDRDSARAHLLSRLDVERDFELRSMQIKLQHGEDLTKIGNEIEIARKRADYELEMRRRNADEELRLEHDRQRIQQEREKLEIERKKAQMDLNALQRQAERDDDRADAYLGMELLAKMKQIRYDEDVRRLALQRLDEEERMRIHRSDELDRKKVEQQLLLERMDVEGRLRQAEREHVRVMQQDAYTHDLNRLEQLSKMGPEALIATAPIDQARVLADLKKTEALKGMSEEQILALAAQNSPEVARAFQEKFRAIAAGEATQQVKEMYERMLTDKDAAVQRAQQDADKRAKDVSEAWEKSSGQSKETTDRALDRMADVAQAFARNPASSQPIVITPSSTGQPVIYPNMHNGQAAQPVSETKVCPTCGRTVQAAVRFCPYCANAFKDMN